MPPDRRADDPVGHILRLDIGVIREPDRLKSARGVLLARRPSRLRPDPGVARRVEHG